MTFPPDSPFNRPDHTLPPQAHRTPPPIEEDMAKVPMPRIEDWYRVLNEYVVADTDPGNDVLEDLRDEIYSYLRG
jgi:hypothetical protein